MINGKIDFNLEAIVELGIQNAGTIYNQRFIVDTGFNGFIAVPQSLVDKLGLPLRDVQRGITADGRSSFFDTVEMTVLWHNEARTLQAQILDEALIGTRLLRGCRIGADWIRDGYLQIEKLES
jgi:clan AA aspartic protease